MKNKYLIVLLLLIAGLADTYGQARSKFEEEISVGVQGGFNISQTRFLHNNLASENESGDFGWHKGTTVGVSGRFIAQNHFGLQLEVNYLQDGWKETFSPEATAGGLSFANASTEGDLNYVSVPLLAHIYFGDQYRFFVNMGPKIAFLNSKSKTLNFTEEQYNYIKGNNPEDPRVNDEIEEKSTDYGICAGCGFEWHMRKVSILGEFRWTYGLQDVYPHAKKDVYQRSNNQSMQFTLGVLLPVHRFHSN